MLHYTFCVWNYHRTIANKPRGKFAELFQQSELRHNLCHPLKGLCQDCLVYCQIHVLTINET